MYPVKKSFLCACAASLRVCTCGTYAAAHRDRCCPLNYGLLPPLCGLIQWTAVIPDGGLRLSLAHITASESERRKQGCPEGGGGGKCDSVCMRTCTCTYVCLSVFLCECTVAMSHTVWGLQCICAQHDKCVLLDSISNLQPLSIWCQLCWLLLALLRDEWDVRNSVIGCFIDTVLWPVPWHRGHHFTQAQSVNRNVVWMTQLTQRVNRIFYVMVIEQEFYIMIKWV